MYRIIVFLMLLFFFISCQQITTKNEVFLQIKKLEFNRVPDSTKWNKIRKSREFKSLKYTFVDAIGKTRLAPLTSIVSDLLISSKDDSLTGECLFALGQIGSGNAEQILLDISFNQLSFKNKQRLLAALSHCASEKTINFYLQHLDDPVLKSDILINAATCSRKNLDIFKIKSAVLDSASMAEPSLALSYFMYYAGNLIDFEKLLQLAHNSDGLASKYILKKLNNLYSKNRTYVLNSITGDSIISDLYNSLMIKSLKKSSSWENQFYAISLAAGLKDSVLTQRISALTKSSNDYVALEALEYLAEADEDLAISILLEQFGKEQNLYKRGRIINIIAKYFPDKAYSFVMQNLDKGNSPFKAQLLDALAKIKSKMALRTLKQFIYVDDPILICSAFDNLKSLGILNDSDITTLLNSEYYSCVTSALEYIIKKGKTMDPDLLFQVYKKFNHISQFEVQAQVVKYISTNVSSSIISADSLMKYASHDIIQRQILENFTLSRSDLWINWKPGFNHAKYLVPDSIKYYSDNPIIEIETERGNIQVELFSNVTPYTVYSILRLVKNNFYDGLTFHRVVPDFVIQGGDPTGSGWGGPDYLIPSEDNTLPFVTGSVGIATSGFDTGSSQFFICQSEQPHLNGNYTLFGQVVKGMNVVYSILPEDKILTIKILH